MRWITGAGTVGATATPNHDRDALRRCRRQGTEVVAKARAHANDGMPLPPVTEVAVAQEGLQVLRLERAPVHLVRGVAGQ